MRELTKRVQTLEKLLIGQVAMNALMLSMLAKSGTLSVMDIQVLIMASMDAQEQTDLSPDQIAEWAIKQLNSYEPPKSGN